MVNKCNIKGMSFLGGDYFTLLHHIYYDTSYPDYSNTIAKLYILELKNLYDK